MFLEKLGFELIEEDSYVIRYLLNNFRIGIFFDPRDDSSGVNIRFIEENKSYSIGWIAYVYEVGIELNKKERKDKLNHILELLDFLETNFNKVIDINFCEEMMLKVEEAFKGKLLNQ